MEIYHEQYVINDNKDRNRGRKIFMLVVYIFMLLFLAFSAFFLFLTIFSAEQLIQFLVPVLMLVFSIAAVILIRRSRSRIDVDYDYIVTDEKFRIVKVFNRKKRKLLINIDIKRINAMGKVTTEGFDRYYATPQIKKIFANVDTNEENLYFVYYGEEGEKFIVITEFSEETLTYIRRAIGRDIMVKK